MDGHFVPNITVGMLGIRSLPKVTRLPFETRLMIADPDFYLDDFIDAGSDSLLVHWEGDNDLSRTLQSIRARADESAWSSTRRLRLPSWKRFCRRSIRSSS